MIASHIIYLFHADAETSSCIPPTIQPSNPVLALNQDEFEANPVLEIQSGEIVELECTSLCNQTLRFTNRQGRAIRNTSNVEDGSSFTQVIRGDCVDGYRVYRSRIRVTSSNIQRWSAIYCTARNHDLTSSCSSSTVIITIPPLPPKLTENTDNDVTQLKCVVPCNAYLIVNFYTDNTSSHLVHTLDDIDFRNSINRSHSSNCTGENATLLETYTLSIDVSNRTFLDVLPMVVCGGFWNVTSKYYYSSILTRSSNSPPSIVTKPTDDTTDPDLVIVDVTSKSKPELLYSQ